MGTRVAEIFEKRLDFESALRVPGKDVEGPPRPWTRLREDIKLNAFIGATLEEIHARSQKADEVARREKDVRDRAAALGIPVGQARGGDGRDATEANMAYQEATDPGHEQRKRANETQLILSEKAKEQATWVKRKRAKEEFDQTISSPQSLAQALLSILTWSGEQGGRGIGSLAALHLTFSWGGNGGAHRLQELVIFNKT